MKGEGGVRKGDGGESRTQGLVQGTTCTLREGRSRGVVSEGERERREGGELILMFVCRRARVKDSTASTATVAIYSFRGWSYARPTVKCAHTVNRYRTRSVTKKEMVIARSVDASPCSSRGHRRLSPFQRSVAPALFGRN